MKVQERIADYAVLTLASELRPLGEVIKPTRPRVRPSEKPHLRFIGMEHVEAHTMRLLGTVPASTIKSSAVHFQPGDVLYGRLRPYLNKVYRPDFEGLCSAEFIVFPKSESLDSRYLQYFLNSAEFVSFATHLNAGDRPRVDFDQLSPYLFPVRPLDQQKRIVAEIEKQFSRLDEAVANLKRVKANLKRYKAAALKAAVEGRLVETEAELARREGRSYETGAQLLQRILETRRSQWQGKGKYKEPAAPDTTDLPELPEGWVWASVGSLGDVIGGLTKNPKRAALPRKLPYLRVANVYANELRLDEITEIGVEDNELEKLLVKKDDLLIVEGNGSPDQIGRLAIWDGSISPCVHQNHLIKVRLPAGCSPKLVVSWLSSPEGRNCVRDVASSTSGLYTLSVGKVSALPVPLPPISEQLRIIEEIEHRLSLIDGANAQVNANLQRATRMRQSILARAFTTGLSVDATSIQPTHNKDLRCGHQ